MALFGPPDVASLKAKRDVQGLIRALGYNGDVKVRRSAAAALGELGDPRAVEPLSLALKNHDWEHNWDDLAAAADALVLFGASAVEPLIALLGWHSKVVRVAVAGALAGIGRPAIGPLIALLTDADLETRETAGQVLADIGTDAIDGLSEALDDEQVGKRRRVAKVLGLIGDPRGVAPLTRALRDPVAVVRQAAAKSLGEIGSLSGGDALAGALRDPDPEVVKTVAQALAEMKDPRAIPALLPELLTSKPQPALDALVKIGLPSVEPMLAMLAGSKARGDAQWIVDDWRSHVAAVLAGLGCSPEVGALVTKLFADENALRSEAASALIGLYQSGGLDREVKEIIRAARPMIERSLGDKAADGDATAADDDPGAADGGDPAAGGAEQADLESGVPS